MKFMWKIIELFNSFKINMKLDVYMSDNRICCEKFRNQDIAIYYAQYLMFNESFQVPADIL